MSSFLKRKHTMDLVIILGYLTFSHVEYQTFKFHLRSSILGPGEIFNFLLCK